MKKAGTCPAFVSFRCGLLLVHLVGLLVRLLLAVLFLAVLLVHLLFHLVRLLVHLFVLRDRGETHARKHRRDEDCNKLLHRHPLSGGLCRKTALRRSPLSITHTLSRG